jgi:purine-binding chemotaxis protein CheW
MDATNVSDTSQYLTFTLGDEDFAIEIAKVREVLDYTSITKVPRSPAFLRGVINLRGSVVPVIDLRMNLNMGSIKRTVDTCIVIVDVNIEGESIQMGALADSVQEVVDIDPSQIGPPPTLGTKLNTEFIEGMGKRGDNFLIILDIDKVLSSDDMSRISAAVGKEAQVCPERAASPEDPPSEGREAA